MKSTHDKPQTRIQREKTALILAAALEVFARDGFRGSTIDQIAGEAGISKPNLLYYFADKADIHAQLLEGLLDSWLDPLRALNADGEPLDEIAAYVDRKLDMARTWPRESRLFANEILRGAPQLAPVLHGPLKALVDEKAAVIAGWSAAGRLATIDPHHLIFSIWSTTQHYADFDVQVRALLPSDGADRFDQARETLRQLFVRGLRPSESAQPS